MFDAFLSAWAEADPLTLGILLVFGLWSISLMLHALYHGLVQWWRNQQVEIPLSQTKDYSRVDGPW